MPSHVEPAEWAAYVGLLILKPLPLRVRILAYEFGGDKIKPSTAPIKVTSSHTPIRAFNVDTMKLP